jgi:hypothetical protein
MAEAATRKETGCLVIDFINRGVRCRAQTALPDSVANRKRAESMVAKLKSAMGAETFAYRDFFTGSPLAGRFDTPQLAPATPPGTPALPTSAPAAAASPTTSYKDITATWPSEHQIEWRRSHFKVLKCTLDGHLLPHFGDRPVGTIVKADILTLRTKLADLPGRAGPKLSPKRINGILAPMRQILAEAPQTQHSATGKLSDYVFCNKEGKPLDNDNFGSRVWYPLLRHLDLKKRRPYQMRHTAATLWLASGEAPEWIARQLGHSSTEMLFRVYSRYVPNLTRRDGSAIDRLLATRFATSNVTAGMVAAVSAPSPDLVSAGGQR